MLLSIIIPTNTSDYLESTINEFVNWNPKETELVIIVNGVRRDSVFLEIKNLLGNHGSLNQNLRVIQSNTDNLIDALNDKLSVIYSDYVSFIGNDDLFLRQIENYTSLAKQKGIDAIKYPLSAVYFWPKTKSDLSHLYLLKKRKDIKFYNPSKYIYKLLKNVGQGYLDLPLVNFYHGVVSRSSLEKNKIITGNYVGGFSPDIYFAVSLSLHINKLMYINEPLSIAGIGKNSYSAKAYAQTHTSNLSNSPLKTYNDLEKWDLRIPDYYSTESVWASTFVIAMNDFGHPGITKFDYHLLALFVYLRNKNYRKLISFREILKKFTIKRIILLSWYLFLKIFNRIKFGFNSRREFRGLEINQIEDLLI